MTYSLSHDSIYVYCTSEEFGWSLFVVDIKQQHVELQINLQHG